MLSREFLEVGSWNEILDEIPEEVVDLKDIFLLFLFISFWVLGSGCNLG